MRILLAAMLVLGSSSMAQAISGTVAATFQGFQSGIPQVRIEVNLACSLTCDSAAPVKHFSTVAGLQSYYSSAPTETADYSAFLVTDLDLDGQASVVTTNFEPGSTTFVTAKSVTCHCGNRNGEGGFIDLTTGPIVIPAVLPTETARVGSETSVSTKVDLRGAEQVVLKVEGGGLNQSKTFGVADLSSQGYAIYPLTFTAPGAVVVTATLQPSGVASTAGWIATPRTSSGTGGGSAGTGGGAGGGGGGSTEGCSATGGTGVLCAIALLLARRLSAR